MTPPPAGLGAVPSLDALAQDPAKVSTLPPEVAAALAPQAADRKAQWESLAMALWVRAMAGPSADTPKGEGDHLISIREGAKRLGVSPDWIYRRTRGDNRLPFLVSLGGKVQCSIQGLNRYLQRIGR